MSAPRTFMDLPRADDLATLAADVALLGVPHFLKYRPDDDAPDCADGPRAIRAKSKPGRFLDAWDFDLNGPLFNGKHVRVVDCGDLPNHENHAQNQRATIEAVQSILARRAVPFVLGGDDSVVIPFFRAFAGRGPLTVVQLDAHIDWRDEVNGLREGYSSPMRRASEMPHFERIVQIGLRGAGSARAEEVETARQHGATFVTARHVHERGAAAVLEAVPDSAACLVTLDCDALDPSVMPAVRAPVPGGLTFAQTAAILQGLARKARIAGFDLVELAPNRDLNGLSALTAGRILLNLLGAMVRSGQLPVG